jgi:glycosidase
MKTIHPFSRIYLVSALFLVTVVALVAAPGEVWHEPAFAHPDLAGPTMRSPLYEAADNTLTIYQGFWKNNGNNGDQNGGTLFYRFVPRVGSPGAWTPVSLGFHSNVGTNQFWKAVLPSTSADPDDVIEYYLRVTFVPGAGSNPETTYLHGGDLQNNYSRTTSEATAQAAPYSIRNRPGWIYHNNNRTIAGNDLQVRLKTGYIGPDNDPSTLWATNGAVYYTTDGSTPAGSLGVASGTSQAAVMVFDGIEGDASGNGNAAFWRGTLSNVLTGLPLGAQVKYKIGLWNTANNEEKFADHLAGLNNDTFVYQNGQIGQPALTVNGLSANYTTTKLFVDEIAGDSIPLSIVFQPGEANVTEAEIYTNLNRRDRADDDANGDGYEDGISAINGNDLVAGNDAHYYKAYTMSFAGAGTYTLTLPAEKTGAYRLTARWKVSGDPNWRWYTNGPANRRDHAITVSPKDARNMVLYEINVLNIEATGDTFETRSTIEDMHNAPGAPHNGNNRWDLDYLKALGANWLWFQPVHPPARDGREPFGGWGSGNPPYEPGSPYAVKNFFEISPIMTKNFSGSPFSNTDLLNQANRDAAMAAWQVFVGAADNKDVGIMLDAPFNHTGFDVELAQAGIDYLQPDGQTWSKTDEIRNREARFFSSNGNYANRASSAANIAAGPDRYDFGKWNDVKDVFFGRYDSLVETDSEPERSSYTSEGDWFDATDTDWTNNDFVQNSQNRNVTRNAWRYFARYGTYWLEKTRPPGQNRNSATEPGLSTAERYEWDSRGIDGLRCDFGQGLPPQAWEYIINTARERKWNFVMMSESLDGGAVTYRSNRHFDVLNENIVFPLKSATTKFDYRNIFEGRRNAYGQGLVLINNVSHDEENYDDPWEALIRYSVAGTLDGVPMIFPGQELGISKTVGYTHYELNFGKQVPHFKRFNSMMPAWNDSNYGNDQLFPVYAGMGAARNFSPALRSSKRWFLDGNGNNAKIHAVAKYEQSGVSPATQDVVLAFANLDRNTTQADQFKIPAGLATELGLKDGRNYNVKNIAAYTAQQSNRRDLWLWGSGITGANLKSTGFFVQLYKVPTANSTWIAEPFEAQYLKVYDVTALPAPGSSPASPAYALDGSVTFTWNAVVDAEGLVPVYRLTVTRSDTVVQNFETTQTSYTVTGLPTGVTATATVTTLNPNNTSVASSPTTSSGSTVSLASADDTDGDGTNNGAEHFDGTNPLDAASVFKVTSATAETGTGMTITWTQVPGKTYLIESRSSLTSGDWVPLATNQSGGTYTDPSALADKKFYRVRTEP